MPASQSGVNSVSTMKSGFASRRYAITSPYALDPAYTLSDTIFNRAASAGGGAPSSGDV
jgi:hypothetical protein